MSLSLADFGSTGDLKQQQIHFLDSLFRDLANFFVFKEREINMDYFMVSKHQAVEENILYTAKVLLESLDEEKHIDELFLMYAKLRDIVLNLNIERILYISLAFLYSFDLITIDQNMIKRSQP